MELVRHADGASLLGDLANPTSNKIYTAIGYEPVCDFAMMHFVAP